MDRLLSFDTTRTEYKTKELRGEADIHNDITQQQLATARCLATVEPVGAHRQQGDLIRLLPFFKIKKLCKTNNMLNNKNEM
jgi:hypothetical protein